MEGEKATTTKTFDELTYFQEYVRLLVQKEPIEGLRVWSQRFTQYREDGQYQLCRRLLKSIKSSDLPPYGLAIIRYSEGWLYDRIGLWQESIAAYEARMKPFQNIPIPVVQVDELTHIGSIYQDQARGK